MAEVMYRHVSKHFDGDTAALRDFSLSVDDGEFMVLVGPSGCGKSTALRLLAGLEDASEGDILIDGRVVNNATPQQRNVAMVFQNYALYPHMSVRANLEFPLRMTGQSAQVRTDKVKQICEILDLSDLLARKPKQLSGGQRQRVAMGRALVRDPSVFLLDEPLSNLDAKLRAQIRTDMARLQQRLHKTTLYVTHDQVEAMTLGDRVAVMNAGQLQQVGKPETLYQHPQNVFVAKFIGNPGMNIFPSTLVKRNDKDLAVPLGRASARLSFSKQAKDALSKYLDQPIFIGIRPESFRVSPVNNGFAVEAEIVSVEYLGHEWLVHFQLTQAANNRGGEILVARLAGQFDIQENTRIEFYVEPGALYFFDADGNIIHI